MRVINRSTWNLRPLTQGTQNRDARDIPLGDLSALRNCRHNPSPDISLAPASSAQVGLWTTLCCVCDPQRIRNTPPVASVAPFATYQLATPRNRTGEISGLEELPDQFPNCLASLSIEQEQSTISQKNVEIVGRHLEKCQPMRDLNLIMPQFVILHHETAKALPRPTHWDLMLEQRTGLMTWALDEFPGNGKTITGKRLPEHRREYLEFEGTLSGDRGQVRRCAWGDYETISKGATDWSAIMRGKTAAGAAFVWKIKFRLIDETDQRWRLSFATD